MGVTVIPPSDAGRLAELRAVKDRPRSGYLTDRGRLIHGPTPPGGSTPCDRETDLTPAEVDEVTELIVRGRLDGTRR